MSLALKICGAHKSFTHNKENVKVFDNFNMSVQKGSMWVKKSIKICITSIKFLSYSLIGPSGAGKSTLFSCLLGIDTLDSGEISIFNQNSLNSKKLAKLPEVVGFMPQELSLVEELTVAENLRYFASLYRIEKKTFEDRFEKLKNVLEISFEGQKVSKCSGGEQRRVSFAIAVICEPALLFLDE